MNNELKVVIRAVDNATKELNRVRGHIGDLTKESEKAGKRVPPIGEKIRASLNSVAFVGGVAAVSIAGLSGEFFASIDAANRYQAALIGLTSVANAFGQSSDKAKRAAVDLAQDGLMTIGEAAAGLKNLLAAGFNLDQAITLMNRFKDSAAFGRQGALGFGEAIVGATEGVKNGNSILVDNAGVTKNLSVLLQEAGFSAQDLSKATSDANIRQAIFAGILRETNPQLGDAARLADTFAGAQSRASVQVDTLRRNVGTALQPALTKLLEVVTPIIEKISNWIQQNPKLAGTIIVATGAFLGILAVLGAVAGAIALVMAAGVTLAGFLSATLVAAVVAAAAAIAMNWNFIKRKTAELVSFVKSNFASMASAIPGPIGFAVRLVVRHFDSIVNALTRLRDVFNSVWNGIKNSINSFNPGSALKSLKIPGFAGGVRNFRGGLAVVGERGPELVNLPRGSDVFTNDESREMVGSTGVTINAVYNNYHPYDLESANRDLGWRLANA